MTSKEIMQKAINTYGVENQMIKTVEELSELSQALCKSLIRLNYTKEKTESEINKRQFAVSYLEKISPETIAKHGDKLEIMLDRKFEQLNQQFVSTPVPVTDARIQG